MITNVTSSTDGVVFTLSNGESYTVTNGKNGANGTVWTIGDDGYWYCDGKKTDNLAKGPKGDKGDKGDQGEPGSAGTGTVGDQGPAGNYYVPNPETGTFWLYDGATDEPIKDTEISFLGTVEGITAVDNGDEVLLFNVDPKNPKDFIRISKSSALKSIVLIPELYADGIEAVEYEYNSFLPLKTTDGELKNVYNQLGAKCTVISKPEIWNYNDYEDLGVVYNPVKTVEYHLNPSSASVKANQVTLLSEDVETISRSSEASIKKVDSAFAVEDGIMTIGFKAAGDSIMTDEDGMASIFAAQVRVNNTNSAAPDTTITSDYTMLYASRVVPVRIAFSQNGTAIDCQYSTEKNLKGDHLYSRVDQAINYAPSVVVEYTGSLDLSQLEIHYNWHTNTKNKGLHKVWKYGEEKAYGLHYDYALVDYTCGENKTSESKYCKLDGSILTPYAVNAQGEPEYKNGVASVGRQPIVRVRVLDDNGKVALVGFIKVNIVKEVEFKVSPVIDLGKSKFGCDGDKKTVTWSQVSDYLLQNTACTSKSEFENDYYLDNTWMDDHSEATQYIRKEVDGKVSFVEAKANEYIGMVEAKNDSWGGTTTDVIRWTLSMDAQQVVYEMPNHTATIYVAYKRYGDSELYAPIYVPLKVEVTKPVGHVTNKVQANWMRNQEAAILNVPQPTNGKNPTPYTTDLNKSWSYGDGTSKPNFNPTEKYASYKPAILANQNGAAGGYKFYFTAGNRRQLDGYSFMVDNVNTPCLIENGAFSVEDMGDHALLASSTATEGSVYENTALYARKDGAHSTADWEVIAVIDQATGEITYQDNALAKELLNKYASNGDGLDRTNAKLFAEIGICAYSSCGVALKLDNGVYPAYFLRPINVYSGNGTFTDATANGSKVKVASLLSFDDWRGQKFAGNEWLLAYYDVKKVTLKLAELTSTAVDGTNFTKLNDVTAAFSMESGTNERSITWNATDIDSTKSAADKTKFESALGTLVYNNQNITRNTFKVKIPVEIEYYWGTIHTEIIATVNNTLTPQ